ncbi:MAG: HEAT repeat domain-containing protein, partial [Microcystaceae cyanobacterium]
MMHYRFPILFAICVSCLSFAPNDSRHPGVLNLSSSRQVAQALAADPNGTSSFTVKNSDYDRYMQAGYEATQKKDYRTALKAFKQALNQRPDDTYAQQAVENVKSYLGEGTTQTPNKVQPGSFLQVLLSLLALGAGGGLFFLLWRFRNKNKANSLAAASHQKESFRADESKEDNLDSYSNSLESKQESYNQRISSEMPPNSGLATANSKPESELEKSLPLQPTTRLANLDVIEELIKELHEPDPKKRRKAIWELAQKSDSRAMKPLVDLMIDSDSQERSLILEALSQISTRTLKPMNQALAISLQDKNPQVRKNV